MQRIISFLFLFFLMSSFFPAADSLAATDPAGKTLPAEQTISSEPAAQPTSANNSASGTRSPGDGGFSAQTQPGKQLLPFLTQWLHLLDSGKETDHEKSSAIAYAPRVPGDILRSLQEAGGEKNAGFPGLVLRILVAVTIGYIFVFIVKRVMKSKLDTLKELSPPQSEAFSLLWIGLVRNLPALAAMIVLAITATITFLLMAGDIGIKGRMLFQLTLGVILIFTVSSIISRIIFSPDSNAARPFDIDQPLVKPLYNAFKYSIAILASGLLIVNLFRELGARPQSVTWVVIVLGTIVIALYCYLILYLKKPVTSTLLTKVDKEDGGWLKRQLASYWHTLALFYLAVVWFIWIGQTLSGTAQGKGQFIVSMLIVPIYFALSHGGKLVITAVIESLDLGRISEDDPTSPTDELERREEHIRQQKLITTKTFSVFRIILLAVLATWILSLWGYDIPFATAAMGALFQAIVIIALALTCWRAASAYIERKLEEAAPEVKTEEEDEDNEFGGAAPRGRIQTLLPMLRKVIGTVLVVMVILIVVSSLGVDIGPLLAGAGVIGLAIGFGAQKLVSDVLSGFFFLLDDAFRVGEYIQAGKIRGTVEAITLRNVMLRHHLGMLQVVPHSDLGAITNYMRGGIVIKFPLEFPYDTDIDQVRKIIKKVGIAMLADETLGDDFILPLKSQGVNEITNSVMVIRVKFTAKPGKQFVIKREAFRRITEALNAKGIYYAHRKVIVDFPEHPKDDSSSREATQKAAQAGAAAALIAEEQQLKEVPPET